MKNKSEYELGDAIRRFHKEEPLKTDLANIVARRVFAHQGVKTLVPDKWLYRLVVVFVLAGVIFSLSKMFVFPLPVIALTVLALAGYAGLSAKEYAAIAKTLAGDGPIR